MLWLFCRRAVQSTPVGARSHTLCSSERGLFAAAQTIRLRIYGRMVWNGAVWNEA